MDETSQQPENPTEKTSEKVKVGGKETESQGDSSGGNKSLQILAYSFLTLAAITAVMFYVTVEVLDIFIRKYNNFKHNKLYLKLRISQGIRDIDSGSNFWQLGVRSSCD